ncbi:MAG: HXXEE domain-containing protein [Candidatus Marinimicrobia bacterium]|nr:HXXEE domain-containing protein [Candidatus Neomarinimicrobiota bacterium]MBL7031334.1 HXXEE domain-containing protein [Candidatus Neomarinimicrobiota bacterium]
MNKITFKISLLFAPLAYAFHHFEESIIFNFREWRSLYFPDNKLPSTELMLVILMAITLVYIILHFIVENKASAKSVILFLMATQVNNMIFHTGGTIVFQDFSPGLITAILLYIPVNIVIAQRALQERWVTKRSLIVIFLLGGILFWSFVKLGLIFMVTILLATYLWIAYETIRIKRAP